MFEKSSFSTLYNVLTEDVEKLLQTRVRPVLSCLVTLSRFGRAYDWYMIISNACSAVGTVATSVMTIRNDCSGLLQLCCGRQLRCHKATIQWRLCSHRVGTNPSPAYHCHHSIFNATTEIPTIAWQPRPPTVRTERMLVLLPGLRFPTCTHNIHFLSFLIFCRWRVFESCWALH